MSIPDTNILTGRAFARAGLVGNPSDGYFGKTISFVIREFSAMVTLRESDRFEIVPADVSRYDSVAAFLREQKLFGYYGAQRLIKATVKRFHAYFAAQRINLPDAKFALEFSTNIPRLVGLSGSSGIVIATMRALLQFYNVSIERHLLPGLVLSVEKDELGITAGLQDRVIQTYEGLVYMDFARELLESRGYGEYVPITPQEPLPVYVAYDASRAEVSDVTHRNLRQLYDSGDAAVVAAMRQYRTLVDRGRAAIEASDWDALHDVTNANFDLRKTIMPIAPENQRMIDVARSSGASAKFAGSGGAICGVYRSEAEFAALSASLREIGCEVFKPTIFRDTAGQ